MRMNHRQRLRIEIAQAAAKLLHEGGYQDYLEAKRKAANQMVGHDNRLLPNNAEIEPALMAHQSLFHAEEQQ